MRPSLSAALALLAAILCVVRAQTPLPLCAADSDGVTVSELVVDSVSSDIQVLQMGEEGNNIVILSSAGSLYTSSDRGRTYAKVPNIEPLASASGERDRSFAFFLPRASSNRMWVTEDAGRTFQQRLFPGTVVSCDYHPTLAQAVLCIIKDGCGWWSTCYHSYVTGDFGRTWQKVAGYVRAAVWAFSTHPGVVSAPDSILVTHTGQTKGGQSFTSSDYSLYGCRASKLDTCIANPLVRGVMFISASLVEGVAFAWGDTRSSVELWASRNFDFRFTRLELPSEFSELSGAASIFAFGRPSGGFIGVSPDYPGGTLYYDVYTSDSWLNDFAFSLGKVVRASGGGADINDFDGLGGVVIANVWAAQGTPTTSSPIQTMITYDNGGKWHRLTPPPGAACPDTTCFLNLAGPAELGTSYFYSNYDAIGLMMGVGTVGSSLGRTDQRTYLTVDGGVTWSEFYAGPGVYEFADHGGFIGFVPTGAATNSLVYSYTGGQQIASCGFSPSLMNVANIATTGEESLDFWVYGTRTLPNRAVQSVVVTVSFSAVHERLCTADDYEAFVPSGFGGSCEMGARVGYQRKKLDAECFNPLNWTSIVVSTEACPCGDEDYECDWCYEYNEFTDTCEFVCDPSAFGRPPPDCPDKWYPASNGWRLVAGTQCLIDAFGALDRLGAPQPCPPPTTPPPETADPTTATGSNGADASIAASVSSVTTAMEASATASVVSVATTAAAAVDSVNAATTSLASSTASLSTSVDSVNAATSALAASAAELTASVDSVNAATTAQATSTSALTSSSGASAASLTTSVTSLAAAQATLSAASAAADSAATAAASLTGSVTSILSSTADTSLSASVAAFGTSARSASQVESTLATTSLAASASRSLSLTSSLSDTRASLSASTASTLAARTSATSAAISTQMESTNAATTTRSAASTTLRATASTSASEASATSLAAASVFAVSASVSTSVATVARTATALAATLTSSTASVDSTTTSAAASVDSTTTASVSTTAAATTGTPPPTPADSHVGALLAGAVVLILVATLGIAFWVRFHCKPAELRQWWQRTFRVRPRDTFTLDDGEVEAGTVSASPLVPMGAGSTGSASAPTET